jgi:hypothetical protein
MPMPQNLGRVSSSSCSTPHGFPANLAHPLRVTPPVPNYRLITDDFVYNVRTSCHSVTALCRPSSPYKFDRTERLDP